MDASQDSSLIAEQFDRFIETVCESQIVWVLKNEEGVATTVSNEFEGENEEPRTLIYFWSDNAMAETCSIDNPEEYEPFQIPLGDFLENWCINMSREGIVPGLDFELDQPGVELDPLYLIVELCAQLNITDNVIPLVKFPDSNDLADQVMSILEEEDDDEESSGE